jgi:biofilm PGA synthesis N-glycosyltransferase PgaC
VVKVRIFRQTKMSILAYIIALPALWTLYRALLSFKLLRYVTPTGNAAPQLIRILICAHNEAENLRRHLPLWLNLNDSNYEVLLVIHASEDASFQIATEFQAQYPHLKVVNHSAKGHGGKREALRVGLAMLPPGQQVVLTDADCFPHSPQFLSVLNNALQGKPGVYAGLGLYATPNTALGSLIMWDTLLIAKQYSLAILNQKPFMAVGRNWGYPTAMGESALPLSERNGLVSGDDDLVLQAMKGAPVLLITSPETLTYSRTVPHFCAWLAQKNRHWSTGYHYPTQTQGLLLADALAPLILKIALFVWLFFPSNAIELTLVLFPLGVDFFLMFALSRALDPRNNALKLLPGNILHTFAVPILWIYHQITRIIFRPS